MPDNRNNRPNHSNNTTSNSILENLSKKINKRHNKIEKEYLRILKENGIIDKNVVLAEIYIDYNQMLPIHLPIRPDLALFQKPLYEDDIKWLIRLGLIERNDNDIALICYIQLK